MNDISLTTRQHDVVELIGRGLDYKAVAGQLSLSVATVRDHARAAAVKLPKPYLPIKARIIDWCHDWCHSPAE